MLALRMLTVHVAFEWANADAVTLLQGAKPGVVELTEMVGAGFVEFTAAFAIECVVFNEMTRPAPDVGCA
jgi:hypothetical protein